MKKLLITVGLIASLSAWADGIGGHCANGAEVGQTVRHHNVTYKVQWLTKNGPICKGMDQLKLVPEHEYISPNVFNRILENASVGRGILLALFGQDDAAQNELQNIKTRECLQADNQQARSCLPKTEVEIAQQECNSMGFQFGTLPHQQCVMTTVNNNRNIKAHRQATNAAIRSAERQNTMNSMKTTQCYQTGSYINCTSN
jgi:hypothetical protein